MNIEKPEMAWKTGQRIPDIDDAYDAVKTMSAIEGDFGYLTYTMDWKEIQRLIEVHFDEFEFNGSIFWKTDVEDDDTDFENLSREDYPILYEEIQRIAENDYRSFLREEEMLNELDDAIRKYGNDHIDLVKDEDGWVYGIYHNNNDSFAVTEDVFMNDDDIVLLANRKNIGYDI